MATRKRFEVTPDIESTPWDAIVIGSGLGGMTVAVGLAKAGKKVLLTEQHLVPGGYACSFRRKKFVFEVSLHQMPALGEGGIIHRMLTDLGVMDRITPIPLKETMVVKSPFGDLSMGPHYLEQLKQVFPGEAAAIDRLDGIVDCILKEFEKLSRYDWLPDPLYSLLARLIAPTAYRLRNRTLAQFLPEITGNASLQSLIAVQWGYFGLPLSRISSVLYLLGWGGFLKEGIYYIKGTSQALSNALIARLEELGGQILLRHRVEKILIEDRRVAGIQCRNRTKGSPESVHDFRAPVVVSNANPFSTFSMLTDGDGIPSAYLAKMKRMEISTSAIVLYVGLDCRFSDLAGQDLHSVAYWDGDQLDCDLNFQKRLAGTCKGFDGLTVYSSVDPDLAPEGKSCLVVIRNEFMTGWKGLSAEEYKARKAQTVEEMLNELESRYPGFRRHIEVLDAGTPRTMERYTSNYEGAFNGFAYTTERVGIGKGGLDIQTPVDGLYLSSAWSGAMSGGYYGCIVNGYVASKRILRSARWNRRPRPTRHG